MENIREWAGNRIKYVRSKAGLTQFQLAEKAGLNLSWLGQIERGQRTATIITLDKICKALNITFGEFFSESKQLFHEDDLLARELLELMKGRNKKDILLILDLARRIFLPVPPVKKSKRD